MSKRYLIIGLIVGAVLAIPAITLADEYYPFDGLKGAKNMYQFNCSDHYQKGYQCNHVASFEDKGNRCYISYDSRGAQSSISCVANR